MAFLALQCVQQLDRDALPRPLQDYALKMAVVKALPCACGATVVARMPARVCCTNRVHRDNGDNRGFHHLASPQYRAAHGSIQRRGLSACAASESSAPFLLIT